MIRRAACLTLLLLLLGCSRGPRMYRVTGEVLYEGNPVDSGEIIFLATDDPALSPDAGRIEVGGKFEIMAKAGTKRVEIRGNKQVAMTAMGPLMKEYIPLEFNADSKLTEEVMPIDNNHFIFDLKPSKKK
jgi:hypothetical protein